MREMGEIDFTLGSSWPYGAPCSPEFAMQCAILSDRSKGPQVIEYYNQFVGDVVVASIGKMEIRSCL